MQTRESDRERDKHVRETDSYTLIVGYNISLKLFLFDSKLTNDLKVVTSGLMKNKLFFLYLKHG